jgi:hypothetical protein
MPDLFYVDLQKVFPFETVDCRRCQSVKRDYSAIIVSKKRTVKNHGLSEFIRTVELYVRLSPRWILSSKTFEMYSKNLRTFPFLSNSYIYFRQLIVAIVGNGNGNG